MIASIMKKCDSVRCEVYEMWRCSKILDDRDLLVQVWKNNDINVYYDFYFKF